MDFMNNELTSEVESGTTTTYQYDAQGQLTHAGATTYAFNATGDKSGLTYNASDKNELTNDGTYSYTYDNEGNEISKTTLATGDNWVYTYDNNNEMVSAVETESGTVTTSEGYKYDALGNRIEMDWNIGGATEVMKYAVDGWNPALAGSQGKAGWNVWAQLNSSGTVSTRFLRGDQPDQLYMATGTGGVYWYLTEKKRGEEKGTCMFIIDF
jgi:YD repeat-containing protein